MEEGYYCPLPSFSLWVCWELHDHKLPLWKMPWWQQLCRHAEGWLLSYQGIISEFSLKAEGIYLNSLDWLIHQMISLGYKPFRFKALFQRGGGPERLVCHIFFHCKSRAVPCWETPIAKGRGHLVAGAAWHQSSCFSWKEKNPHFKMTWHVIAKNKPEDLKGHGNTSTANVVVPKMWILKAWSKATNTINQFGNAMGSQLRA